MSTVGRYVERAGHGGLARNRPSRPAGPPRRPAGRHRRRRPAADSAGSSARRRGHDGDRPAVRRDAAAPAARLAAARPRRSPAAARRRRRALAAASSPTGPCSRRNGWPTAAASGWRPAPDVLVAMLRRHRRSAVLAQAALAWGGPTAAWLVDNVPDLAPDRRTPPGTGSAKLRPLPVPAELEPLLHGGPAALAAALTSGLSAGVYRWSHRAVSAERRRADGRERPADRHLHPPPLPRVARRGRR